MTYRAILTVALLAGAASTAAAVTPCDWKATRARNEQAAECYRELGPTSGSFSVMPEHQAKLEQCLLHVERIHKVARAECHRSPATRRK